MHKIYTLSNWHVFFFSIFSSFILIPFTLEFFVKSCLVAFWLDSFIPSFCFQSNLTLSSFAIFSPHSFLYLSKCRAFWYMFFRHLQKFLFLFRKAKIICQSPVPSSLNHCSIFTGKNSSKNMDFQFEKEEKEKRNAFTHIHKHTLRSSFLPLSNFIEMKTRHIIPKLSIGIWFC